MDTERQQILSELVAAEIAKSARAVRFGAIVGLVLCGGGLALLAAVFLDGGATLDDIGLPLVLFGVFAVLSLLGMVKSTSELRSLPTHPLVVALREQPADVARVTPTAIVARGHRTPALRFELRSGQRHLIAVDERTGAELTEWLSGEGAHIG